MSVTTAELAAMKKETDDLRARIEQSKGRKEELENQKLQVLTELQTLGVTPETAEAKLAELDAAIEEGKTRYTESMTTVREGIRSVTI